MLDEFYSHSMVDDQNSRDDKYPIVHLALSRPTCSLWLQHGCQRVTSVSKGHIKWHQSRRNGTSNIRSHLMLSYDSCA